MPHPFHRSTARLRVVPKDPADGPRPQGSRRPHLNATVAKVRRLIETTPLTYGEIAARTGVGRASICRWTRDGGWQRHLFAPRATDTVPRERAGRRLKLRMLDARLAAVAERTVRELEESANVDLEKLGEALELLKMAKLAARVRQKRRRRKVAAASAPPPNPHAMPALRMTGEMRFAGVNMARVPEDAVKDYIASRALLYQDPAKRPRNSTRRQRHEAWMREKE